MALDLSVDFSIHALYRRKLNPGKSVFENNGEIAKRFLSTITSNDV